MKFFINVIDESVRMQKYVIYPTNSSWPATRVPYILPWISVPDIKLIDIVSIEALRSGHFTPDGQFTDHLINKCAMLCFLRPTGLSFFYIS